MQNATNFYLEKRAKFFIFLRGCYFVPQLCRSCRTCVSRITLVSLVYGTRAVKKNRSRKHNKVVFVTL